MGKHYVTLPSGRRVGVAAYVAAWRRLIAIDPDADVAGWDWYPVPAREVLWKLRAGMHDRTNRHLPTYGRGRKWDPQWQADVARTARDMNTPRLRVYWAPADYRARLAHRLADPSEDY